MPFEREVAEGALQRSESELCRSIRRLAERGPRCVLVAIQEARAAPPLSLSSLLPVLYYSQMASAQQQTNTRQLVIKTGVVNR